MSSPLNKLKIRPTALVLCAPFILLAPVWLAGKALYWGTPSTQFMPWWWQAWQTLKAGELPLWNPLVGMGAPLLANYQTAFLYPPTWVYFIFASLGGLQWMAWGQAIIVAAHLAWAGWGMVTLLRRLGIGELGQVIGGLAFSLSGYLVARAHFLSVNATVAWLPWILLAAYDLAHNKGGTTRNFLKLCLFVALQWLAGHAQISWYTLLFVTAWFIFWTWKLETRTMRSLAMFGAVFIFALALALVQLLPTAEYLLQSQRAAHVGVEEAMTYSFWPWRLLNLIAPNLFGNPAHGNYWGYANYWEDAIYVGFLPLFLAIAGLLSIKQPTNERSLKVFLLSVSMISFLLALGDRTPVFPWLFSNVPTFDIFQGPTRFTIWAIFALSLLASLACEHWRQPTGRGLYWSRLAVAGAVAIVIGAVLATFLNNAGLIQIEATFISGILPAGVIALGAAILNLQAPKRKQSKTTSWTWITGGFLTIDLLIAGWGLNPGAPLDFYKENIGAEAAMRAELGRIYLPFEDERALKFDYLFRFDGFRLETAHEVRETFLPNTSSMFGIPSANNFDPLVPARYERWIDIFESASAEMQDGMVTRMGLSFSEHLDSLEPLEFHFEPITSSFRARWVNCANVVDSSDEAFALVASGDQNGGNEVIIESNNHDDLALCGSGEAGSAGVIESTPNKISLLATAPGGGWLVLADTWYQGWRAFSNGEELTIYPADGVFRAVQLDPGEHRIDFVYRPASFILGLGVSLIAWPLWLGLWLRSRNPSVDFASMRRK